MDLKAKSSYAIGVFPPNTSCYIFKKPTAKRRGTRQPRLPVSRQAAPAECEEEEKTPQVSLCPPPLARQTRSREQEPSGLLSEGRSSHSLRLCSKEDQVFISSMMPWRPPGRRKGPELRRRPWHGFPLPSPSGTGSLQRTGLPRHAQGLPSAGRGRRGGEGRKSPGNGRERGGAQGAGSSCWRDPRCRQGASSVRERGQLFDSLLVRRCRLPPSPPSLPPVFQGMS